MSLYFQFCVLHFFCQKFEKLNITPIFGEEKFFGKLEKVVCLDSLWVENFEEVALFHMVKFRRNCSISHGLGDTSSFMFYSLRKLLILN